MKKQKTMGNKGFSLVELIVVIAIMAVLVGVLAPQFIKYVEKSKESTDIQNISSIATTIQTYYADQLKTTGTTTIKLGETYAANSDEAKILDSAQIKNTLKGTWTTNPSVTYNAETGDLTYAGESKYYKPNSDGSGYDAQ